MFKTRTTRNVFFCLVWNSANDVTPFCPFSDLFLFFLPKNTSTFFSFFFPLNTTPLSPLCWISHAITVLNQLLWIPPPPEIHPFRFTFLKLSSAKEKKNWGNLKICARDAERDPDELNFESRLRASRLTSHYMHTHIYIYFFNMYRPLYICVRIKRSHTNNDNNNTQKKRGPCE